MVQMQYKDSIPRAICSGLERQDEWERQALARLLQGPGGSACSRPAEPKPKPGRDEPRLSPAGAWALISGAAGRSGCSAGPPGSQPQLSPAHPARGWEAMKGEAKGRDSSSASVPLRSGRGLPSIRLLIQHIWTVKAFFSFRRDISRLSAVLQPVHAMSGVSTTQQLLWLMERPIRLYIFIKDCLVGS